MFKKSVLLSLLISVFRCCYSLKCADLIPDFECSLLCALLSALLKMASGVSCGIPENESEIIVQELLPVTLEHLEHTYLSVMGKIIFDKIYNKNAIVTIMKKAWEEYGGFHVDEMGQNKFHFTPWFVMNQPLSLQRWANRKYSEIVYEKIHFWVQVHGLPRDDLNPANAGRIIGKMGTIVEMEDPITVGIPLRPFLRVRVGIDVYKPIWAGRWLQLPSMEHIWIHFKYERLQGLCYQCGMLGHDHRRWNVPKSVAAYDPCLPKFGPFLTATKPKQWKFAPGGQKFRGSQSNPRSSSQDLGA